MDSWRQEILSKLDSVCAPLILVADPDALLAEETMVRMLSERGYAEAVYDDPIAFRFIYESLLLSNSAQDRTLLVEVRNSHTKLQDLPHDMVLSSTTLSIGLGDLFPRLSYSVISQLDPFQLDTLFAGYVEYEGERLNDSSTKDFVLRHVFGIAAETVASIEALVKLLVSHHIGGARMPTVIEEYLSTCLQRRHEFSAWPIQTFLRDRSAFFQFLQSCWERYLYSLIGGRAENEADVEQKTEGCVPDVSFEDHGIRCYVDNLFAYGYLQPVSFAESDQLPEWVRVGIRKDQDLTQCQRLRIIMGRIGQIIPRAEASHKEWQTLAEHWGHLLTIMYEKDIATDGDLSSSISSLHDTIEASFEEWMLQRFAQLHAAPWLPKPLMVHNVAPFLSHQRRALGEDRTALVVVDGLALDQWFLVRDSIAKMAEGWRFEETTSFAWVPTLTTISRQCLFSGRPPFHLGDSILSTNEEPRRWTSFWEDQGLPSETVAYSRGLGSGTVDELLPLIDNPRIKVLGLAIDTVDSIMHGEQLGTAGMHQHVRFWSQNGYLLDLLGCLRRSGFSIYLTADHGNIAARGQGIPREGCLAQTRGRRARLYDSDLLRERTFNEFPKTIKWPVAGLPEGYYALLSKGRTAFTSQGDLIVSHGGIAMEEVIIPFVKIW